MILLSCRLLSHFTTVQCLCILVLVSQCRLARASQTYLFPVHLTDQLLPSAVFYATVGPLLVYMAIHRLVIIPYTQAQKEESVHLLPLLPPILIWQSVSISLCQKNILTSLFVCMRNCLIVTFYLHQLKEVHSPGLSKKGNILAKGVVNTSSVSFTSGWLLISAFCVSVLLRELELQRKSSATDIAKKKQEAESAVSTCTHMQPHSYSLCVWWIIDHCFWVSLSSLCLKTFLLFYFAHPHPSSSLSFSLGSDAGSADAGVCEENHRSGGIQDGWGNTHTYTWTLQQDETQNFFF